MLNPLMIKEMQIKIKLKYVSSAITLTEIRKFDETPCWQRRVWVVLEKGVRGEGIIAGAERQRLQK